jgi:hypothetical protein
MTDEDHTDDDNHPDGSIEARSTAPQSEYTAKQTALGAIIALFGLAITFGVPLAVL